MGHWINQRGNEIHGDKRKLIHNDWKTTGHIKSSFKIEVYSKKKKKKSRPQETRKWSNKQPKLTLKSTRGRTKKPKGKKS